MFWRQKKEAEELPYSCPAGWISVEDKLPIDGLLVWVLNLDDTTKYLYECKPKLTYKLRIYEAKFHRSKGWELRNQSEVKVMYWTPLDHTGVNCTDYEFITEKK